MKGIKTWAVSLLKYSVAFLNRKESEIQLGNCRQYIVDFTKCQMLIDYIRVFFKHFLAHFQNSIHNCKINKVNFLYHVQLTVDYDFKMFSVVI